MKTKIRSPTIRFLHENYKGDSVNEKIYLYEV